MSLNLNTNYYDTIIVKEERYGQHYSKINEELYNLKKKFICEFINSPRGDFITEKGCKMKFKSIKHDDEVLFQIFIDSELIDEGKILIVIK